MSWRSGRQSGNHVTVGAVQSRGRSRGRPRAATAARAASTAEKRGGLSHTAATLAREIVTHVVSGFCGLCGLSTVPDELRNGRVGGGSGSRSGGRGGGVWVWGGGGMEVADGEDLVSE